MLPLVSIIIPAYNAEQWISETLHSALAQTWPNTEIIIVDDGSTDATLKVAQGFSSDRVKVITQENRGAAAARNRGLQEAQGDYIQYLDADDLLAPEKIEKQLEVLQASRNNSIASGPWGRFFDSPDNAEFISEVVWADMNPIDWLIEAWQGGGMMILAAWLCPKSVINKAGFWNEELSYNDDGEFFCRVILESSGVVFVKDAKSYYRSGISTSLSRQKSITSYQSFLRSCQLNCSHIRVYEDTMRVRSACASLIFSYLYAVVGKEPDLLKRGLQSIEELNVRRIISSGSFALKTALRTLGLKPTIYLLCLYRRCKDAMFTKLNNGSSKITSLKDGV